jgi:hypothetical protein
MNDISLNLMRESIKRAGNRLLTEEELREFILATVNYESEKIKERMALYEAGDIKENEINEFEFYTDGKRHGIFIETVDENILPASKNEVDEDGDPLLFMILYKKDKYGNKTDEPTGRILMRIKSRLGSMGIFIGQSKFEELIEDKFFVLVGNIKKQFMNNTTQKWESESQRQKNLKYAEDNNLIPDDYSLFPSYSLNVVQLGEVLQSGKNLKVRMPKCNWKNGDEE